MEQTTTCTIPYNTSKNTILFINKLMDALAHGNLIQKYTISVNTDEIKISYDHRDGKIMRKINEIMDIIQGQGEI